ncbi:hypothetical protein HU200_041949 [Digitaria exilis]|uniref:Uncharacterized protein n=1 Tax=Digitaria exilis TaxID=1010633 RepID=A0A835BE56_9POAL|nr:hypothetical protein HU200_041949 [Digitaria exilis]
MIRYDDPPLLAIVVPATVPRNGGYCLNGSSPYRHTSTWTSVRPVHTGQSFFVSGPSAHLSRAPGTIHGDPEMPGCKTARLPPPNRHYKTAPTGYERGRWNRCPWFLLIPTKAQIEHVCDGPTGPRSPTGVSVLPLPRINPRHYGAIARPTTLRQEESKLHSGEYNAVLYKSHAQLQNPTNKPTNQPRRFLRVRWCAICSPELCCAGTGRDERREEMRCKLHPYANAVGVCAPCLRDRLLALAAERAQAAADASTDGGSSSCGSSPPSLPLPARRRHHHGHAGEGGASARGLFPRSVSPYAAHRRSDAGAYGAATSSSAAQQQPNLLFFRTPQVGPTAAFHADDPAEEGGGRKKAGQQKRSFLSAIFGGGRRQHGRDEEAARRKEPPRRSTSWLSAIIRRKRRPVDLSTAASFPAPPAQVDEEPESPSGGSSNSWWFPSPSPARQQQHHRRRHGGGGGAGASGDGISGFTVCLSPLVRPSSAGGRRRCQPPDPSSLGESHRRHASAGGAASFGRNTSRKLADMGRFR